MTLHYRLYLLSTILLCTNLISVFAQQHFYQKSKQQQVITSDSNKVYNAAPEEQTTQYIRWMEEVRNYKIRGWFDNDEEYQQFVSILSLLLQSNYVRVIDSINIALPPEEEYGRQIAGPFYTAKDLVFNKKKIDEVQSLIMRGCDILKIYCTDKLEPPFPSDAIMADNIIIGKAIKANIPEFSFRDGFRQSVTFVVQENIKNTTPNDTLTLRLATGIGDDGSYLTAFPDEPIFFNGDKAILYLSAAQYKYYAQKRSNTTPRPNTYMLLRCTLLEVKGQEMPDASILLREVKEFCRIFQDK